MGFLVSPRAATYLENTGWLADSLRGGQETDSGIRVTPRTAVRNVTVLKCVLWRANQIGMLAWKVFENIELLGRQSQREARQHPLFRIVHRNPNPETTAKSYWGMVSADLHLWGNSYAYIERGSDTGRPKNLWRFMPHQVELDDNRGGGPLRYIVTDDYGNRETFLPGEILHFRGLSYDGRKGISRITEAREAYGWNEATQRYGAQFFKNASRPSGLIIAPNGIKDPKAKAELIENLRASGKNAGTLKLIEGAFEYKPMSMPQNDAQFIETMQFQEEYLIGLMEVPQHKVQVLRRSTNNNIEHQGIEAVTDCLQPLATDIEQQCNLQLLSDGPGTGRGGGVERDRFFVQAELKTLMRGDTAAQTTHIEKMIDKGVYSQNDGRHYLGLPPVVDGDTYWMNMAYGPIDQIRELLTQQEEPEDDGEDEGDVAARAKLTAELQSRFRSAYNAVFRDAVGKTMNRAVKDRERAVPGLFGAVLTSLAAGLSGEPLPESFTDFLRDYLDAMGKRSKDWTDADEMTAAELDRAVKAFVERAK